MDLSDLKRIALRGLQREEDRRRDEAVELARAVQGSDENLDGQLAEVAQVVESLDSEIDEYQQKINELAARKALLQRRVETLISDLGRDWGIEVIFERAGHNGRRRRSNGSS